MEEINKKTLIEALSTLKEHSPPSSIWEDINMELELGPEEIISTEMLAELPEHDPPPNLWEKIAQKLDVPQGGRIVSLKWRKTLTVAASFIILFSAYFILQNWLQGNDETDEIALIYSIETIDDLLLKNDWQQDDEAFEMYKELCGAKQYICEHPEFQVLQQEFEELSSAVEELEYAIGNYGSDANLISQIKEIELERTDLFKKMMVMLI